MLGSATDDYNPLAYLKSRTHPQQYYLQVNSQVNSLHISNYPVGLVLFFITDQDQEIRKGDLCIRSHRQHHTIKGSYLYIKQVMAF